MTELDILADVADRCGVPAKVIFGKHRNPSNVLARQTYCWMLRMALGRSNEQIARIIGGGRSANGVHQFIQFAEGRRQTDQKYRAMTEGLRLRYWNGTTICAVRPRQRTQRERDEMEAVEALPKDPIGAMLERMNGHRFEDGDPRPFRGKLMVPKLAYCGRRQSVAADCADLGSSGGVF